MNISEVEKKLIDTYPACTAIVNKYGDIQCVNEAWAEKREGVYGFFGPSCNNANYFELLAKKAESGNDYALKIILGFRQVVEGDRDFSITYPVPEKNEKHWFKITIRSLCVESERYMVFHEDVSQLINTSHQLRESQERYKQQFDKSSMAILIGKPEGELFDANKAASEILGYSYNELLQSHRNDLFASDDPRIVDALKVRAETGEFQGELEMVTKSGDLVPVEITSKIYRNEAGHLRTLTMFKDISDRKKVEEKLELEQRFTETALNSLPGLFTVFRKDGKILRWNMGYSQELGYDPQDEQNKNIYDIAVAEDHGKLSEAIESALKVGVGEIQVKLLTKSGKKRDYKFRGGRFESKQEEYIVATGIDITEKLEIEREKDIGFQLMKQLFDNSPVGIVLSDKNYRVERVNSTFTKMFGYSADEVWGKRIDDLISPAGWEDEAAGINEQVFKGISTQTETRRMHKNGILIPVLLGTVPVKVSGEVIAAYGIYIDISERMQLEKKISELFEMEKLARKEVEKSKLKLEEMFAQSPTSIALLEGDEFRFTLANASYQNLVGGREIIGKKILEALPELKNQGIEEMLHTVYTTGEPYIGNNEKILINDDKGIPAGYYLNYTCKPLYDATNKIYGIFIEAVNVTELVNSRNKVQTSLEEKEILLKEVHHRVKNNLAVIIGLMDLQMMDTDDDKLVPKLREVQSRIFSIAQIHEAIYQQEDVVRVKFDIYLKNMIDSWKQNSENDNIKMSIKLDSVDLNLNQAVSFGLLTNEIMNLIQYCRDGEQESMVNIILSQKNDRVEIGIENPNLVISSTREIEQAEQFNLKIIQVLLNQLTASYRFENGNTKKLLIQFEKANIKGSSSSFI